MKTIFLCGFMGCGKSTIGRLLAKKLGRNFIDLDDHIEKTQGKSISEIFQSDGEEFFRRLETDSLKTLGKSGAVIATGGGALLSEQNARIAAENGVTVFIDVPFDIFYQRIKNDKSRPIAFNSTKEQLKERYDARRPLYRKNSSLIVSGDTTPLETAAKIAQMLI